jgi:sulfate adenylyltransferase subunit 2
MAGALGRFTPTSGARRDEERSRQRTGPFVTNCTTSLGSQAPAPRTVAALQHPESQGESLRVFPLSNWTELDVWLYIYRKKISVVPLYFARRLQITEVLY